MQLYLLVFVLVFYLNLSLILNLSLSNKANIGSFNLSIPSFRAVVFIFALGMCVSISICLVLVSINTSYMNTGSSLNIIVRVD